MLLLIWLLASLLVASLGRHRALGFWGFFLASVFFSPLLLTAILLFTRPTREPAH